MGDKVIIYSQAKKAILYRPDEKKIIEVAPFTTNPEASQQTQPIEEGEISEE